VTDHDEPDAGPDAETEAQEAPAPRPPALVLAISLAVVFAVAAAVLGIVALGSGRGEGGDVTELRRAAGEVGEALLTYDYRDPKAHEDRVLRLATGSFRGEYEDFLDQGFNELAKNLESTSEGFVKDVYVSEVDQGRGEAIVRLDVKRVGTGGPRTVYDIYELLSFVRVDGTWKVDQVTDLNFATSPNGDSTVGGTTSTSTPVP
jgi:hypothetical protein